MSLTPKGRSIKKILGSPDVGQNSVMNYQKTDEIIGIFGETVSITLTETSDPATPTYSHVVEAKDLPKMNFGMKSLVTVPVFGMGVLQSNVTTRTIFCRFGINGEKHTQSSVACLQNQFACAQDYEWNGFLNQFASFINGGGVKAGDTVEIYLWSANPSDFELQQVGICFVPFSMECEVASLCGQDDTDLLFNGTNPYPAGSTAFAQDYTYGMFDGFNGDKWGLNRNVHISKGAPLNLDDGSIIGIFNNATVIYQIPRFLDGLSKWFGGS